MMRTEALSNNGREYRRYIAGTVIIVLLTLAALGRIVGHPFVTLDDKEYVTENSFVLRGLTAEGFRWALTTFEASNWHPATWLSHMTDIQLFGLSPAWHHAMSLLLHTVAAVVLFLVLAKMTGASGRSFFVAALFAIHPLHVESVAWVAERKDVLSGLLFTITLAAWLRYAYRPAHGRYFAVVAVFALGLMTKGTMVTLPFLLLLLDFWPLGRFPLDGTSGAKRPPGLLSVSCLIMEKVPLFVLSIAAAALTYTAQSRGKSLLSLEALALPWRLANAALSVNLYLYKSIWPTDLAVLYAHPGKTLPLLWCVVAFTIVLAVTILSLGVARRLPWVSVGWLWYLGMLVPVIGLIQAGSQGMADRYTYLPLIGIFFAFVWGAEFMVRRHSWHPHILWLAGGSILIALATATFVQAGYWRDSRTLLSHAVLVNPNSWMAVGNLALVAETQGRREEAIMLYRRAAMVAPDSAILRFNLGTALARSGRLAEAEVEYRAAIALDPGFAAARNNLANLLFRLGRRREALDQMKAAFAAAPNNLEFRANLKRMESIVVPR